ncbi:MAG: phosphoribosylformylglycinamidine synthase subunit PurS, partial [Candidatus Omnitrophica bacterium]|nr:phosphoribosylformylglycinamidine synthase subunit PurS [Candidatus Omnitrophota bacterium]
MEWKIEIKNRSGVFDPLGNGVKKDIKDLGIVGIKKVSTAQVFIVSGSLSDRDAHRIARELLTDPVTQEYQIGPNLQFPDSRVKIVEIAYNSGVMDPVEGSTRKAIKDLGISGVNSIRTERKYILEGKFSESQFNMIREKLLYNKVIQHVVKKARGSRLEAKGSGGYKFKLITVNILGAGDKQLMKISKEGQLFLNLREMREIKAYFKKLKRNPTDCELETIAQTWSEHCGHKTFRGVIDYKEKLGALGSKQKLLGNRKIDNLLKNTVMKATKDLDKPWCVSVFKDNAGIIRFDEKDNICFKVETHNHPSALEPYGGAGTGIGGVIRDILGVGLGAKPIMNTDVFCFGLPDTPQKNVPKGMLHPKRIMKGVVNGVRDYGNRMGIPTSNGAILFDERYTGNPLVYCGTLGIMPKDKSFKAAKAGDLIVAVGGRTGRDGIHGATFSSGELTHESEAISGGAVQIGNPIMEKKVTDTLLKARDKNLYDSITDCGAGGFSSAVGEMGQDLGAEVDLEKAPLKYHGLTYTEIWI